MEPISLEEQLKEQVTATKGCLKRERKKLKKQEVELLEASNFEQYSQWADTLLAKRAEHKKGMKELITENIHTSELIEIKLNPKCNADKNAELLYKKARKGKRGYDICAEKVADTNSAIELLQSFVDRAITIFEDGCDHQEAAVIELLKDIQSSIKSIDAGKRPATKKKADHPFRHYHYNGYDIYAGKTSTDNDQLSTRFAKPSDIWFHAVGFAGSHVIIRRPKGAPYPPAEIVEIAGGIAVFFSKAKNTSYAEVHITEARFVRKPKHSPAGLVTAERCKTKRMSPVDPQKLFK